MQQIYLTAAQVKKVMNWSNWDLNNNGPKFGLVEIRTPGKHRRYTLDNVTAALERKLKAEEAYTALLNRAQIKPFDLNITTD